MQHIRKIHLRDQGELEIQCDDNLYRAVREYLKIESEEITDDMLKEFLTRVCRDAVQKAEQNATDKIDVGNSLPALHEQPESPFLKD